MIITQENFTYESVDVRRTRTYFGKATFSLKFEGIPEGVESRILNWIREQNPTLEVNWKGSPPLLFLSFLFKVEKPSKIPTSEEALEQTKEQVQRILDPSFYQPLLEKITQEKESFADEYEELLQHTKNRKRNAENNLQKARERFQALLKLPSMRRDLPLVVGSIVKEETTLSAWKKFEAMLEYEQAGGSDPLSVLEIEFRTQVTDHLFGNPFNSTGILFNAIQFEAESAQKDFLRLLQDLFYLLKRLRERKELTREKDVSE